MLRLYVMWFNEIAEDREYIIAGEAAIPRRLSAELIGRYFPILAPDKLQFVDFFSLMRNVDAAWLQAKADKEAATPKPKPPKQTPGPRPR